jgi:hypothetical protein
MRLVVDEALAIADRRHSIGLAVVGIHLLEGRRDVGEIVRQFGVGNQAVERLNVACFRKALDEDRIDLDDVIGVALGGESGGLLLDRLVVAHGDEVDLDPRLLGEFRRQIDEGLAEDSLTERQDVDRLALRHRRRRKGGADRRGAR